MISLPKILIIEDDRSIASALAYALKSEYDVNVATNGKLGIYKTHTEDYGVIVLDLNLPDLPGIIICQQIRNRGLRTPILILSGDNKAMTKIGMLDAGANDYLTKPFSLGEFKARLRVLVRETTQQSISLSPKSLAIYGVILDRQSYNVTRDGVAIPLRRKEFDILEYLLEHAGKVVTREALLHHLWPNSDDHWTNTITVHIKSLRDKLDRPFSHSLIQTVHGRGYKLDALVPASKLSKVM